MLKIIKITDEQTKIEGFKHLFEFSTLPEIFHQNPKHEWSVRDGYKHAGTLLVGDLRVLKQSTNVVEIHPFPEWLVEILQPNQKVGKAYAIVPNWSEKLIGKIARKTWSKKLEIVDQQVQETKPEEWLAIEYSPGVCIKIPPYVPHDFISVYTNSEIAPYLQCFEPNFEFLNPSLGIDPTALFPLKNFNLSV